MGLLIPAGQTDIAALKMVRDTTIAQLKSSVRSTTSTQPLIFRDLVPQDLNPGSSGLVTARFTNPNALVAQTVGQMFSIETQNFQSIGIYGYAAISANPQLDQISFNLGSAVTLAQYFLDSIYADQSEVVGYFEPTIWTPQQQIIINGLSQNAIAANAESFVLLGIVMEPAGRTVQPTQVA